MSKKTEIRIDSNDKKNRLHVVIWEPEENPIGVLQIVHGMKEYIDRYDEFARFMTEQGFAVIGHDHLGHGETAVPEDYGFFAEKGANIILLKDIHSIRMEGSERFPSVPYFILGHSMGSFLTRQYICKYSEGLAGAIIMGTGDMPNAVLEAGKVICELQAKIKGWHYRSEMVENIAFGTYNKHFEPARTTNDWLSKDESIVDKYIADPLCTFRFTLNGYYNLFLSIERAHKLDYVWNVRRELPILMVSGQDDPVGDYGKGVEEVRSLYEKVGIKDLTCKLYDNDRHEILNETDRQEVYQDINAWIHAHII